MVNMLTDGKLGGNVLGSLGWVSRGPIPGIGWEQDAGMCAGLHGQKGEKCNEDSQVFTVPRKSQNFLLVIH